MMRSIIPHLTKDYSVYETPNAHLIELSEILEEVRQDKREELKLQKELGEIEHLKDTIKEFGLTPSLAKYLKLNGGDALFNPDHGISLKGYIDDLYSMEATQEIVMSGLSDTIGGIRQRIKDRVGAIKKKWSDFIKGKWALQAEGILEYIKKVRFILQNDFDWSSVEDKKMEAVVHPKDILAYFQKHSDYDASPWTQLINDMLVQFDNSVPHAKALDATQLNKLIGSFKDIITIKIDSKVWCGATVSPTKKYEVNGPLTLKNVKLKNLAIRKHALSLLESIEGIYRGLLPPQAELNERYPDSSTIPVAVTNFSSFYDAVAKYYKKMQDRYVWAGDPDKKDFERAAALSLESIVVMQGNFDYWVTELLLNYIKHGLSIFQKLTTEEFTLYEQ